MEKRIESQEVIKTNKKKNRSFRRLFLLIFTLIFTGVLATWTTYAWFTANQTVRLDTITVNVEAQNGIQISADGTNWRAVVTAADLQAASTTTYMSARNQIPTSMEPVSTVGNINANGEMEMFYGTVGTNVGGDYILTATEETDTNGTTGRYVAFDLFFRVDADTIVYLTPNSGVTTTDIVDTGIKNGSRIGFVVLGNTPVGSSLPTIQGLNGGVTSPKYIWEPNYDVHTAAGVAHALNTYGHTTTQTGGTIVPYTGVKAEITTANNVLVQQPSPTASATTYSTYFDVVTPTHSSIEGFATPFQLFTFTRGITKVRIYMWIEGQDVDTENDASGGTISFDLQITTVEP